MLPLCQGVKALLKDEPWAAERRAGGLVPAGMPGAAGIGAAGGAPPVPSRPKALKVPNLAACVEYTGQARDALPMCHHHHSLARADGIALMILLKPSSRADDANVVRAATARAAHERPPIGSTPRYWPRATLVRRGRPPVPEAQRGTRAQAQRWRARRAADQHGRWAGARCAARVGAVGYGG